MTPQEWGLIHQYNSGSSLLDKILGAYSPNAYNFNNLSGIENILNNQMQGNSPVLDTIRSLGLKNIKGTTNRNIRTIKERLAGQNLNSAVGANLFNEAYGNEQSAINELEGNIGLQRQSFISDAISKLLGIEGLKQDIISSNRNYGLNLAGLEQSRYNTLLEKNRAEDEQKARENSLWGDILGAGLGFAGNFLLPGIGGAIGYGIGKAGSAGLGGKR